MANNKSTPKNDEQWESMSSLSLKYGVTPKTFRKYIFPFHQNLDRYRYNRRLFSKNDVNYIIVELGPFE